MKKIKYLLALSLSILCIGAVSANAATISTTMADEITLFENMGFNLPEKTNETDFVTRGEFIGTITQLLNTEFSAGGEYSFTDVPKAGDISGAVNYAVAMGIVSDDTMFYPDNNVTYPQAMKMAVAFLGRAAEAEYLGGYDGGGYNAIASTLKLYSGLQDVSGEFVTLRDFYKLLYNVGQADMLVRDTNNNLVTGNSPFEEYFNMYQIRGIVTHNEDTSLEDDRVMVGNDVVAINGDTYRYEDDAPLGYSVDGWASNEAGDMPRIVLIKPYKNQTTEVSFVGLDAEIKDGYFYYDVESKEEKLKLDDPVILYNDIAAPNMKLSEILNCKLGTAVFIDNDDDNDIDVIDIHEYRPVIVSVTSSLNMRIVDKNGAPAVELDNNGKVKKYSITKDGAEIGISELSKGDFLMVYESKKGTHVKAEVVTSTISGTVTTYNSVGRELKLDSTTYTISDYFNSYYLSKVAFNSVINVIITPDNVIHAYAEDVTSTTKYGYIIKWWENEDTGKLCVRMADEKGNVRDVQLANKVTLDGKSVKEGQVVTRFEILKGRGEANLLIKYALSEDETQLKVIDTYDQLTARNDPQNFLTGNEALNDQLKEWNFPKSATTNPWYTAESFGYAPYLNITGKTKIYVIESGEVEPEEKFKLKDLTYYESVRDADQTKRVPDGGTFAGRTYRIFNVDRFGNPEAIVLNVSVVEQVTAKDPRALVYRISRAMNDEGEITYEFILFANNEYKTYLVTEDLYEKWTTVANSMDVTVGDYIGYKVNLDDEICATELVFDRETRAVQGTLIATNYIPFEETSICMGKVYDLDGSSITVLPAGQFNGGVLLDTYNPETDELISFPMNGATINIVSADGKSVMEGSMGDVETFVQVAGDADFVVLRLAKGVLKEVVLYK